MDAAPLTDCEVNRECWECDAVGDTRAREIGTRLLTTCRVNCVILEILRELCKMI